LIIGFHVEALAEDIQDCKTWYQYYHSQDQGTAMIAQAYFYGIVNTCQMLGLENGDQAKNGTRLNQFLSFLTNDPRMLGEQTITSYVLFLGRSGLISSKDGELLEMIRHTFWQK
jgi:hypothetical protein